MRLLALLAACVLAAVFAAALVTRPAAGLARATADRPDEVGGPQVHAIYAVPSDGETVASTRAVRSKRRFARSRSGSPGRPAGRPCASTPSGGALDVTFVRLEKSDAALAATGAFVRDGIEAELRARGLIAPDKLYAVYYDGSSTWACGGGAWPPALPGQVAAMYLRGAPPGAPPCAGNPLAAPGAPPGYMDIAMLHELLHTRGYVATCAAHHTRAGHTSDNPNDLMWAGDAPWQLPPRLDIGRDDYYGHARTDCPDLARDPYLTSSAPPDPVVAAGKLRVGPARAGRQLAASVPVTVDGAPAPSGRVVCRATTGGRVLPVRTRAFAAGIGRCTWSLARSLRGRRVTVSVTVTASGRSFRRTATVRVT